MGGSCCHPAKDTDHDQRVQRRRDKTGKSENVFKQQLEGPEFIVERRDSIGMVAKQHTAQIMNDNRSTGVHASVQSDTINTKDNNTNVDSNQSRNVFTEGTFNGEQNDLEVAESQEFAKRDSYEQGERTSLRPVSCLSFGNKADFRELAEPAAVHQNPHASVISIKDIQETRDKVPASPATALQEPMAYFK